MQPGDLTVPEMLFPDPLHEAEGMNQQDFHANCRGELAHLPDVYRDDPELLFGWVADAVKKEVRLVPRSASPVSTRAATAAEEILGLNRAELKGLRWTVYEDLEIFRNVLTELDSSVPLARQVREKIRTMMDNSGEFAGMVRYFVRDAWNLNL